ncbi:transmembrane protein [Rhynchospora pubera]|uniref:Transmembrane protein n=1 Tax=Rhynchospora pubera TaxID=906938 RepID=A0AAV8C6M9_9POAL|nr:transmembrane protein [Rhynchospora pubera]
MSTDTNTLQYWINWRFLLCTVWVLCPMVAAAILIRKYEGPSHGPGVGVVYSDESWRPCFKHLNPAWLLAYRLLSFFFLLFLLFLNFAVDGLDSLFYYTIWTFFLVTLYFAIGSVLSIHGCRQYRRWQGCTERRALIGPDSDRERGTYVPPTIQGIPYPTNSNANSSYGTDQTQKEICFPQVADDRKIAGFWGYLFQIIYQTNAGAVMITDCVFWFVIFPFRAMKDYDFNLLLAGTHSVNVVFLIGDITLNSLQFPWFRIAYFLLFTGIFVIFQWAFHACVSMWWPYPFMDLSLPLSPLWYFAVAALHLPCYAVFPLVMKLKHYLLSRFFPHSYHLLK